MARYLDPKVDLTFKKIFGQHPRLLISFLNAVMPFEEGRYIETVEYLPSDMAPDSPNRKYSIVDVRCIDNKKNQFIVEIQSEWQEAFMSRILFNAGKAFVRQLGKGKKYNLLQPVYTLVILNDTFDHITEEFYHHFKIINIENSDEIIEGLEFVLVELPKFRPPSIAERKLMVLWLRFLKEVDEDMRTLPPEMMENEDIRLAAELCEEGAFTPEERARYDGYWDWVSIENTKKANAEAKAEKEKENAVKNEKKETALKALQMGMSIEDASKLTGLSIQQIEEILKNLNK